MNDNQVKDQSDLKDENKKDDMLKGSDEQVADETSSLGTMSEDVMDIDDTAKSVGLPTDDNGPRELNSQQVLEENDKED